MKRVFTGFIMLAILAVTAVPAWAGGDKVRGEEGSGAVNQVDFNNQGKQNQYFLDKLSLFDESPAVESQGFLFCPVKTADKS